MSKIKEIIVNELHKPARRTYPRRKYIIRGFDDTWQADLGEFGFYAKENKGYKYILFVIDTFSKFLWTAPLKNKSGDSVTLAMKKILESDVRRPKKLQTDAGKEFYNKKFQNLLQDYNITLYSTYTIVKAAMAERVIKTIKEKLYKMFGLRGNNRWYDILDDVTNEYNRRKHRTIKMRPCDVTKNTPLIRNVYAHIKIAGARKLNIGDVVRISKQKTIFSKGYTQNWTTELFKIYKINISTPVTYLLEDMQGNPISGGFYEQELQKTKYPDVYLVEKILKRKGTKMYIKWLGLDRSHNSWIDKKDIGL